MRDLKLVRSRLLQKIFEQTQAGSLPLDDAVRRLEAGEHLLTVARSLELIDEESEAHFRDHWFAPGGYLGDRDVEGILRAAFIQALRMASSLHVPIAGFWLSGAEELAAPVLPSPSQVTLLVLTPTFPGLREEGPSTLFGVETEIGIHFKG